MPSYINDVMGADERLVYSARISLMSFLPSFIWMGILFGLAVVFSASPMLENMAVFFVLVILGIAARIAVCYYGTELGITDRRIIAKTGIIRRDTIEINVGKIESIHIAQSILGRIFNFGTVTVAGSGTSHAPIKGVDRPLEFRRKFDEVCAKTGK